MYRSARKPAARRAWRFCRGAVVMPAAPFTRTAVRWLCPRPARLGLRRARRRRSSAAALRGNRTSDAGCKTNAPVGPGRLVVAVGRRLLWRAGCRVVAGLGLRRLVSVVGVHL